MRMLHCFGTPILAIIVQIFHAFLTRFEKRPPFVSIGEQKMKEEKGNSSNQSYLAIFRGDKTEEMEKKDDYTLGCIGLRLKI